MPLHERGKKWYIFAGIFIIVIIGYSVISQAWTFTFVSVLTCMVYFATHKKSPLEKEIQIFETGFKFEGNFIPWKSCSGFWFKEHNGYTDLHIVKNNHNRGIVIQTGSLTVMELRKALSTYSQELVDQKESVLDIIIRICKI